MVGDKILLPSMPLFLVIVGLFLRPTGHAKSVLTQKAVGRPLASAHGRTREPLASLLRGVQNWLRGDARRASQFDLQLTRDR